MKLQFLRNITSRKVKIFIILIIIFSFAFISSKLFSDQVIAQIVPILVSEDSLDFGTVFPGEELQGSFAVHFVENDEEEGIAYEIIFKRKPLPDGYPGDGDPEMTGYYRNLCPFLTPVKVEAGDGDDEGLTYVGYVGTDNPSEHWIIYFKVPAIMGNVGQSHVGGVVTINDDYGCDISINIKEWVLFDSFTVPATTGTPTESNKELESGVTYKVEAAGTYYFRTEGNSSGYLADAEWALRNDAYGTGWTKGDGPPYSSPYNGLDLCFDTNINTDWGDLDEATHTYNILYTGTGSKISLFIKDGQYSDNSGYLTINIYSWE